MTDPSDRTRLVLFARRALLGERPACLRAVAVSRSGKTICLEFYLDGAIGLDDRESAECVASEVVVDFPEAEVETEFHRADAREPLRSLGSWVFQRSEGR